jgi:putrescine---pyruvate transaminase
VGAIELKSDGQTLKAPLVVAEAAKRGLICRSVVFDGQDVLVFAPPLIINQQQIDQMITIINEEIQAVEK